MARDDHHGIRSDHVLTNEFNEAAAPPEEAKHAKPTPEYRPPFPAGPGLGSLLPELALIPDRDVSPQLRDQSPDPRTKPVPHREAFNTAARSGLLRAIFERKARDHEKGPDQGL